MSPEKTGKKKSSAKAPSKRTVSKTPVQKSGGGSNGPFYVLVIIILVTVIVLLLNKFYEKGNFTIPYFKAVPENNDKAKVKKEFPKEKEYVNTYTPEEEKDKKTDSKDLKDEEKKTEPEKEVNLFFLKLDEKSEKIYLSTVKRKLPDNQLLSSTLEQLIKGPTPYEQGRGYITAVPSGLKIRSVVIKGKTAEIDFNGVIEEDAAGDIILKRVQQIVNTATQFENVDSIIIKINGQRRKTIGADGLSIGGPLRR